MKDIIIKSITSEEGQELESQNSIAVSTANAIMVSNDEDYSKAAEFLKDIKTNIKTVEKTFAEMKEQAHKAHKAVCSTENEFKNPLLQAEAIIKTKMQEYLKEQEIKRRAEEERIRAEQKRLAEEQLARAVELEAKGDIIGSSVALQTATTIDNLGITSVVNSPKVDGISTQTDYEISVIDEMAVPIAIGGIVIRQIDLSVIKSLVKTAKGKISIPGIKIEQVQKIRARA